MNAPPNRVVVKVGGSLYDHPRLGAGLRDFVDRVDADRILVVAGGGGFADAVRDLDCWQRLGEERSHRLALSACNLTMHFLRELLECEIFTTALEWWIGERPRILPLGPSLFLTQYETSVGPVPHTWELTTDSIAALAAKVANARLILLKSTDIPSGTTWLEAASRGWVDAYFPTAIANATFPIEAVNFRRWLDERFPRDADG
jgi:aspartokinase-like uncharacterized kinase